MRRCRSTTGSAGPPDFRAPRRWRRRRPPRRLERKITVRFDANITGGLPWKFEPEQNTVEVKLGQVVTGSSTPSPTRRRARPRGRPPTTSPRPRPAAISRRSTASASRSSGSGRANAAKCRSCSMSTPSSRRMPSRTDSTRSRCPIRSMRCASRRGRQRIAQRNRRPRSSGAPETGTGDEKWPRRTPRITITTWSIRARGRSSGRSRPCSWRSV